MQIKEYREATEKKKILSFLNHFVKATGLTKKIFFHFYFKQEKLIKNTF